MNKTNNLIYDKLTNDMMVLSNQDIQEIKDLINTEEWEYAWYTTIKDELLQFLDWAVTQKVINPLLIENNFDTPRLLLSIRVWLPKPKDIQNKRLALKVRQLKRMCNSLYLLKLDCSELSILRKYIPSVYYLYFYDDNNIVNKISSPYDSEYYIRRVYLFEYTTLLDINYYLSKYFKEHLDNRQQIPSTVLRVRNKMVKVIDRVDKLVSKIMNKENN